MKKIIRLSESNLIKLIKNIITEDESENYELSPEQYMDLLKRVNNIAHAIPKLPQFKGKRIVVNGSLDLSKKPITSLGNIIVNGSLDISYTNVKSLEGVEAAGYVRSWNTPYEEVQKRIARQKLYNEAEERREENVWNLNDTDTEGEMANAAFQYAVSEGLLKDLDDDEKQELIDLKNRISELESRMEAEDDEDLYDELSSDLDEAQERMDELSGYADVYDLVPTGRHYDLHTFESLEEQFTISVGTIGEADESVKDYYDDWIDQPEHYLSTDQLEYHIDGDQVAEDWEDAIRNWIYEDPESYNIEKELSRDQEEEIWLLEMEKWVYENEGVRAPIYEPTKEDGDIFDFTDEEDNRFKYKKEGNNWVLYKNDQVVSPRKIYDDEDTQENEDDRDNRISDIESEIEDIKDNPDGDLDDDSVESYVEDKKYQISRNPVDFLKNEMGFDSSDIIKYVDKDDLLNTLISDSDYGETLNGYDGTYDEITINATDYIVMRTD
jgi:hypothetical protein